MTPTRDSDNGQTPKYFDVLIGAVWRRFSNLLSRSFETINIDSRSYAVMALVDAEQLNQLAIALRLKINKNVMVQLIDNLEKQGLCRRVQRPATRRREYYIQLTEEGKRKLKASTRLVAQAQEEVLKSLSDQEKNTLLRILRKLTKNGY